MAVSLKYGQVAIAGVPDDEPVFVIRAQDVAAPAAISAYKAEVRKHGAPAHLLMGADRMLSEVTSWQFSHPGRVKVPD